MFAVLLCLSRFRSGGGSVSSPSDDGQPPPRPTLLRRVLWVALPLQLLLLLLLLLAFLLPLSEDHYCAQSNTLAHSLYPTLRYTNGPPPV